MSAEKWEPLMTAEAVLAALEEGAHVEYRLHRGRNWYEASAYSCDRGFIQWKLNEGREYRVRIEGTEQ